jgi:hypothetical protein
MKAVVYEGPGKVSAKDVPDADIKRPTDVLPDRAPEGYEDFDNRDQGRTNIVLFSDSASAGA